MAIQHRRGVFSRFDPSRLLPGEWAVVLEGDTSAADGMGVYICFAAGTVKRMATYEDMVANIANADAEIVRQLTEGAQLVERAIEDAEALRAAAEEGRATAEQARASAESSRISAETARASAETGRAAAESDREDAEDARAAAESARATAEQGRDSAESSRATAESGRASAESSRASAEADRASAETARVSAEDQRKANETSRKSAETQRANAETARASAETGRATAEAARVASFAEMEQRSKGWLRYYCQSGEYDAETRKPTISDPDTATLYYVPVRNATSDNEWVEWMWDTSVTGGRWEALGTTEATIDPITTAQVDKVASGESVTGSQVLNATGLTYLWAKLKAAFAALSHTHAASDITSGTLGVARGGTGQTTAAGERNRLGLGNTTGPVPVANGGTGASDAAAARSNLDITPANIGAAAESHDHSGHALTPASVAATGAISGSSVSDSVGSLAQLRDSVSQCFVHRLVGPTSAFTIGANATLDFTFELPQIDGYIPFCMSGYKISYAGLIPLTLRIENIATFSVTLHNINTRQVATNALQVSVLYVRNGILEA